MDPGQYIDLFPVGQIQLFNLLEEVQRRFSTFGILHDFRMLNGTIVAFDNLLIII